MFLSIRYSLILLFAIYLNKNSQKILIQQKGTYSLDFYTQYNQFYLFDRGSPGRTDANNFWTKEAFDERLAIEQGILGIGTESYGHIKGKVIILAAKNRHIDYSKFDHIVEGGLIIKSGILEVLDCPNSKIELKIGVKPGSYCVRIFSSNLVGNDIDENEGTDYYTIEIWPGSCHERRVLKQYKAKQLKL